MQIKAKYMIFFLVIFIGISSYADKYKHSDIFTGYGYLKELKLYDNKIVITFKDLGERYRVKIGKQNKSNSDRISKYKEVISIPRNEALKIVTREGSYLSIVHCNKSNIDKKLFEKLKKYFNNAYYIELATDYYHIDGDILKRKIFVFLTDKLMDAEKIFLIKTLKENSYAPVEEHRNFILAKLVYKNKIKFLTKKKIKNRIDFVAVKDAEYANVVDLASGSIKAVHRQKKAVSDTGLPLEIKTQKIGIHLRLIPAGSFIMGNPKYRPGRRLSVKPHKVTLTDAYYVGKYEITQAQWKQVMGNNPSEFKKMGDNAPVEMVSWYNCQEFLKKLCKIEGVPRGTYQLLTDAEWEYACRAGTATVVFFGDSPDNLYKYGNYADTLYMTPDKFYYNLRDKKYNDGYGQTAPVGSFLPNAYGLYDMYGNVSEWCFDWFGGYPLEDAIDPQGIAKSKYKTVRGSDWQGLIRHISSFNTTSRAPRSRVNRTGVRIKRVLPTEKIKDKANGE
jgi:formylglycine-generating enzyme required for sulfatase activity